MVLFWFIFLGCFWGALSSFEESTGCNHCITSAAGCAFIKTREDEFKCVSTKLLFRVRPKTVYKTPKRCQTTVELLNISPEKAGKRAVQNHVIELSKTKTNLEQKDESTTNISNDKKSGVKTNLLDKFSTTPPPLHITRVNDSRKIDEMKTTVFSILSTTVSPAASTTPYSDAEQEIKSSTERAFPMPPPPPTTSTTKDLAVGSQFSGGGFSSNDATFIEVGGNREKLDEHNRFGGVTPATSTIKTMSEKDLHGLPIRVETSVAESESLMHGRINDDREKEIGGALLSEERLNRPAPVDLPSDRNVGRQNVDLQRTVGTSPPSPPSPFIFSVTTSPQPFIALERVSPPTTENVASFVVSTSRPIRFANKSFVSPLPKYNYHAINLITHPDKHERLRAKIIRTFCRLEKLFKRWGDINTLQIENIDHYQFAAFKDHNPVSKNMKMCA